MSFWEGCYVLGAVVRIGAAVIGGEDFHYAIYWPLTTIWWVLVAASYRRAAENKYPEKSPKPAVRAT